MSDSRARLQLIYKVLLMSMSVSSLPNCYSYSWVMAGVLLKLMSRSGSVYSYASMSMISAIWVNYSWNNEAQNEALVKESGRQERHISRSFVDSWAGVWVKAAPSHQLCGLRVMRARQRDAYVTLKSGPRRLCPPERITHEALIIHE